MTSGEDLTTNVLRFCEVLRCEYALGVGHAEAHDALRAMQSVGVCDATRVRAALRAVCCGAFEEIAIFERAFEAFFMRPEHGLSQPSYHPRHTRQGDVPAQTELEQRTEQKANEARDGTTEDETGPALERRLVDEPPDGADAWQALRARYSPTAARSAHMEIPSEGAGAMRAAARRLIAAVRLGHSRRWQPQERGARFDLRRTLRASLQTGGDPVYLRRLGHPKRHPRFVILVDGSRSMAEHTAAIVQFAAALVQRSQRSNVFCFSTELRDVTRELRAAARTGRPLPNLGAAWGGGTKIGASLHAFLRDHAWRVLSDETLVIVFSDGLDVGDIGVLERAMRDLRRRAAAVVWLNPHAGSRDYAPTAIGMHTVLPYLAILTAANDANGFSVLATRLARTSAIKNRRR